MFSDSTTHPSKHLLLVMDWVESPSLHTQVFFQKQIPKMMKVSINQTYQCGFSVQLKTQNFFLLKSYGKFIIWWITRSAFKIVLLVLPVMVSSTFVKYKMYILSVPWEIQAPLGKVSLVRVTPLYLHWSMRLSASSVLVVI